MKFEPINPAPPVTRIVCRFSKLIHLIREGANCEVPRSKDNAKSGEHFAAVSNVLPSCYFVSFVVNALPTPAKSLTILSDILLHLSGGGLWTLSAATTRRLRTNAQCPVPLAPSQKRRDPRCRRLRRARSAFRAVSFSLQRPSQRSCASSFNHVMSVRKIDPHGVANFLVTDRYHAVDVLE